MFNRKQTGTARIANAVATFETVVTEIEQGIAENAAVVQANEATIAALVDENTARNNASLRGATVVQNLRMLLA